MFMHSIDKNYSPLSYGNSFCKNSVWTENLYNLRNFDDYFIQRVDNKSLRRLSFSDWPKCWNNLALNNPEISSITNKFTFKSTIKDHLLSKSENFICNKLFCWP